MWPRYACETQGPLTPKPLFLTALFLSPWLNAGTAHADSIRNTVREHVNKGLESPKKEDPPKPAPQEKQQPKHDKPENKDAKPTPPPQPAAAAPRSGSPPPQAAPGEAGTEKKALAPTAAEKKSLAPAPKSGAPSMAPAAPPPATPQPASAAPAANKSEPHSGAVFTLDLPGAGDSKDAPKGPPIPQRIFGTNLKLDPKIGGGLRGWIPAQYPTVKTSADIYYTWSVDVSGSFFRYINLHRGYFESNGLAAPRHQGASAAVEAAGYAKKAAWLLGVIGVPITKKWEPVVIYESRAFQSRAIPQQPVRIVPFNTSPDADLATIPLTTSPLTMVSGFETFVLAMRYNQSGEPPTVGQRQTVMPPFYFGLGLTQYSKPYQVTVGDSVLDSVLFDARFRGAGLALGTNLPGKPDSLILDASLQFGLGEVRLLDRLTLNELLPNKGPSGLRAPEWVIGYLEGNLSIGYLYALLKTKPTVLVSAIANGGGARFAYIKTRSGEGESVNMPSLNWDFLWGVMGYVTVPL
jgi:hypothetical protein